MEKVNFDNIVGVGRQIPIGKKDNVKEKSLALLQNMPVGCDPIEYLKNMRKRLLKNTVEDALMRKLMKNQLTFFTYKLRLDRQIAPCMSFPVKKYGQKYSSAPNSPLKLNNRGEEISDDLLPAKRSRGSHTGMTTSTTTGAEELSRLECINVHLMAAMEYEKDNRIVEKGWDKSWSKGIQEPFQLIRTLTKKSVELMDILTSDLDEKYWRTVSKAGAIAGEIFAAFSDCGHNDLFSLRETGLECLIEKSVNYLMEDCGADTMHSIKRKTLVEEMVHNIKVVAVRHLLLEKLLSKMHVIIKRFGCALDPLIPSVIKFSDITGSFYMLQLVEYILMTTQSEPWIEEPLWDTLCRLEDKMMHKIKLAHVLIFISRQVNLAKRLVKFSDVDSDSSQNY